MLFRKILLLIAVSRRFPSFLSNLATSPNPNLSVVLQSPPPLELRMSHFGRSGPPDISDTYSLLVLNITFRTTADDLFPLFDKYGKVVDIFIPRDRRTGESRGFAFVRYKYADEAQKAVDRLDGRVVDGREITVQFAKYGPNAEKIHKGRIVEMLPKSRYRSRSRSPRRRSRDDYRDRDYRRRSRSRSVDRYDRDRYRGRDRDYYRRSRSRSISPDYRKGRGRDRYEDDRRSRSRSVDSASPCRRSPTLRRSPSPQRSLSPGRSLSPRRSLSALRSPSPGYERPGRHTLNGHSPSRSPSPGGRPAASRSPSPQNSDAED
ncbi:serine/arginine-rich splicing factor SC35-like isoform X2 [Punica granatum]|uniref:Serine/arginine-rich splicing factor SC35-like isoform X2 n=1 Tax=Punica granatum TaxID=22663 RepID=A0A6P8CXS8_PUNGR|nr:serine/arginine-rich splicing factor SC35-like isoform X2 [Punica granatum]